MAEKPRQGAAPVIGLTGGIATGKSTVAGMMEDLGARLIDADAVSREVVAVGEPAWQEIVTAFGAGVLSPDRSVDRRLLGDAVFGRPEALRRLNDIVHPRVIARIEERVRSFRNCPDAPALVVVAPLLIEAGICGLVDEIWLVTLDRDEQVNRLMRRDHFSVRQATDRLMAQMPQEEKVKYAHHLIDNSGDLAHTRRQVEALWGAARRSAT
jgi:dephospho-CoA kinase